MKSKPRSSKPIEGNGVEERNDGREALNARMAISYGLGKSGYFELRDDVF